jgi:hypothetical protein
LETPSDYLETGVLMSGSSAGYSVLMAIDMGEKFDTGSRSEVDFSREGGDSVVDPIIIEWS